MTSTELARLHRVLRALEMQHFPVRWEDITDSEAVYALFQKALSATEDTLKASDPEWEYKVKR